MSCESCDENLAAKIDSLAAIFEGFNQRLIALENRDMSAYLLKSELVSEIDKQKDSVVSALMGSSAWSEFV